MSTPRVSLTGPRTPKRGPSVYRAIAVRRGHGDATSETPSQSATPPALELLELLASSPHGATEALLVRAHGFNGDMIAGLVRVGLAIAERETMKAGAKPVEVVRVH